MSVYLECIRLVSYERPNVGCVLPVECDFIVEGNTCALSVVPDGIEDVNATPLLGTRGVGASANLFKIN